MGLQRAMLLVPICYALSGVAFLGAEIMIASEKKKKANMLLVETTKSR
jgi:hypothetical protein